MSHSPAGPRLSRRQLIAAGGSATAGSILIPGLGSAAASGAHLRRQSGKIPARAIQSVIGVDGMVSNGVLSIDLSRDDIGTVKGPAGVEFDGSFEVDGMLHFQPLGHEAFFNGCLALREREVQGFIDTIIAQGLTFQALHQHYVGMDPQIWFVHWRGVGEPRALAARVRAVLRATSIKLPQTTSKNPKSPLDHVRLAKILHGDATVGDQGVVTVDVLRSDRIVIGDVVVNPQAGVSTNISFKPLNRAGTRAAAAPDFAMSAGEVQRVTARMRSLGWFDGCLYNQETAEVPQLYFSHMAKIGDPYALAAEMRSGIDLTHAK